MNASHPSGRVSSSSGSLAKFAAMRRASSRVIRFIAERRRDAAICPESGQEQTSQIGVTKSVFDPKATSANLKVVGSISGFKGTCQRHIAVGE